MEERELIWLRLCRAAFFAFDPKNPSIPEWQLPITNVEEAV